MSDLSPNESLLGELIYENKILKNRCRALTHGLICQSCKIKCDNREREFGDWSGIEMEETYDGRDNSK